jgi:hypothetical protein
MKIAFVALAFSVCCAAQESGSKPRVYITDSNSWEISGAFGTSGGSGGGAFAGGARPQTAEIIRTFNQRCSEVTVTFDKSKARFIVLLDHEGGKGAIRKDTKIAVFKSGGDVVYSGSTRSIGNAVKDACAAMRNQGKAD